MQFAIRSTTLVLLGVLSAAPAAARPQPPGPPGQGEAPAISPGEIQRMFDAYALMRAQDDLGLRDEQYAQFLARFKALQDVRRNAQQERLRIIADLNRLTQPAVTTVDEKAVRERLSALRELEARAAADVKKAYDALDQVLDVRQQARFRVFEEQMERRKLELLTRARQGQRPMPPRQQRPPSR